MNVQVDFDEMAAAKELLSDRQWRLDNLYRIETAKGKFVKFKQNRVQKHFDANKHTRNVIGKSRQHGFTTWETIDCLDQALFMGNQNIMIIAHVKDDATEIFSQKVLRAWESMPPQIKQLINEEHVTGQHQVIWDSTDDQGEQVAAGLYFCRIETDEFVDMIKLVLVR